MWVGPWPGSREPAAPVAASTRNTDTSSILISSDQLLYRKEQSQQWFRLACRRRFYTKPESRQKPRRLCLSYPTDTLRL